MLRPPRSAFQGLRPLMNPASLHNNIWNSTKPAWQGLTKRKLNFAHSQMVSSSFLHNHHLILLEEKKINLPLNGTAHMPLKRSTTIMVHTSFAMWRATKFSLLPMLDSWRNFTPKWQTRGFEELCRFDHVFYGYIGSLGFSMIRMQPHIFKKNADLTKNQWW